MLGILTAAVGDLDADRLSEESFHSFRAILQIGLEVVRDSPPVRRREELLFELMVCEKQGNGRAVNVSLQTIPKLMSAREERAVQRAVAILEGKNFVSRLSDITGEPLTQLLKRLPGPITKQINRAVRAALAQALDVAVYKMGSTRLPEPHPALFQVASGITGGLSGFFGMGALALELPVTTTLMLRSIAGIATRNGEQLQLPAARLACLEVFALGPQSKQGASGETSYYATRAFLAKTVSEAASNMLERGLAAGSAPVIVDLVQAIGSRFGIVVTEKVAAGAIPVVGAVGGAAVNLAFMQHFQQVARAHFAIRQLERRYGAPMVRGKYQSYDELRRQQN